MKKNNINVKKIIKRRIELSINKSKQMPLSKNERVALRIGVDNKNSYTHKETNKKFSWKRLETPNTGKAVKIICCYFGERRTLVNTPKNINNFLKLNLQNEIDIENGMNTDVVIINNDSGNNEKNEWLEKTYHNQKTNNGRIVVETRPNIGGSFGAFYYAFLKYENDYNYWFFCEDDVLISWENYMKDFADFIDMNNKIGFVSLAPIVRNSPIPTHSGGGCGLTTTEKFKKAYDLNELQKTIISMRENLSYNELQKLEVGFTNAFIKNGLELINHPDFSDLPSNFFKIPIYKTLQTNEMLMKKFIYMVGY